jgi:serine/threonine-protein kinase
LISEAAPHLPPEIDSFFARALARDVEERFASASELADELDRIARGDGTPVPSHWRREMRARRGGGSVRAADAHGSTVGDSEASDDTSPARGPRSTSTVVDRTASAVETPDATSPAPMPSLPTESSRTTTAVGGGDDEASPATADEIADPAQATLSAVESDSPRERALRWSSQRVARYASLVVVIAAASWLGVRQLSSGSKPSVPPTSTPTSTAAEVVTASQAPPQPAPLRPPARPRHRPP